MLQESASGGLVHTHLVNFLLQNDSINLKDLSPLFERQRKDLSIGKRSGVLNHHFVVLQDVQLSTFLDFKEDNLRCLFASP